MNLIHDEEQVKKFYDLISPLEKDEVFFLSLSARNKYLTEEERREVGCLRSEMFGRKIVKEDSFEYFLRAIRSYELQNGWFNKGRLLPDKCLVVYANINPSSGLAALKEFYERANEILFSLHTDGSMYREVRSMDTILMNCYQRSRSRKNWVDIDIDASGHTAGMYYLGVLLDHFRSNGVECHPIATKSGYHILLKRSTIKYNYTEMVRRSDDAIKVIDPGFEVVVNANEMIPIPGTLQSGFEVRLI